MAKFDYRQWVTNYKTSNKGLFEQFATGSITGSQLVQTMYQATGSATGSITGSCDNFNTLTPDAQLTACQAFYNLASPQNDPNLTQWVDGGNCCGEVYTGSMAQGMPSMTRRPQRKNKNKNEK
jgi:hypothetical protein